MKPKSLLNIFQRKFTVYCQHRERRENCIAGVAGLISFVVCIENNIEFVPQELCIETKLWEIGEKEQVCFLDHVYSNVFKLISVSTAVFIFVVLPISSCVLCKGISRHFHTLYENVWSVALNRYLISLPKIVKCEFSSHYLGYLVKWHCSGVRRLLCLSLGTVSYQYQD